MMGMGTPKDEATEEKNASRRSFDDATSKEKIEISIQQKRECFGKAKKIVEQLLEKCVAEDFLLSNIQHISQSDYQDVVEERALAKFCGYPLCINDLGPVPNKRFHISTATNRVYDITERKNFCSSWCYKASIHLKDQVSTSPVWFREYEKKPEFSLLPSQESGASGEEVTMQFEKLKASDQKVDTRPTVSSFAFSSLEKYQNDGIFSYESLEIKENFSDIVDLQSPSEVVTAPTIYVPRTTKTYKSTTTCGRANGGIHDLSEYEVPRDPKKLLPTPDFFPEPRPQLAQSYGNPSNEQEYKRRPDSAIQERIMQGTTEIENKCNSFYGSNGPQVGSITPVVGGITNRMSKHAPTASPSSGTGARNQRGEHALRIKKAENPTPEPAKFDLMKTVNFIREWFTIVSLFHLLGSEDAYKRIREKIDILAADTAAPDWQPTIEQKLVQLCREMNIKDDRLSQRPEADEAACSALDLKVAAYYQGKTSYDPSELLDNPVLPTVERFEPNKARQKIILVRLDKVVPELADILRLNKENLSSKLQQLTGTFELSAHNIMMKPAEWNLMGLIILKLLAVKYPEIQRSFRNKKTKKILKAMLVSMNLQREFLENLQDNLCDISRIVSKMI